MNVTSHAAAFLLTVLFGMAAVGCAAAPDTAPPAPPPDAQAYRLDDEAARAAYVAFADLNARLRQRYGGSAEDWQATYLQLPATVRWHSVRAHYAAQLQPPWQVDPELSGDASGYRARVWRHDEHAFAVALVDAPAGQRKILIVLRRTDD